MKLRELPLEFEKKGVRYTQLEKNNIYVLYRCEALGYKDVYYEVFEYKVGKPHPLDSGGWDAVEIYPSNELFGTTAYCCSDLNSVRKVMKKHFNLDWNPTE